MNRVTVSLREDQVEWLDATLNRSALLRILVDEAMKGEGFWHTLSVAKATSKRMPKDPHLRTARDAGRLEYFDQDRTRAKDDQTNADNRENANVHVVSPRADSVRVVPRLYTGGDNRGR